MSIQRRTGGWTLMEFIVGLAIIGISVAIIARVAIPEKRRTMQAEHVRGMERWAMNIRSTYQPRGSFVGATAADLRRLSPAPWQQATTVNPMIGGAVTPAVVTYLSLPSGGVSLSHASVPRADCGAIADGLQPSFSVISINGTAAKSQTSGSFTRATADTLCNVAANTITVTVNL